ncbi:MAG: flippase-like domain-containing protein [Pseudomonadales bacterium]|nr:flippase-like domain-containing protein [Pseudomonadales bacterium]
MNAWLKPLLAIITIGVAAYFLNTQALQLKAAIEQLNSSAQLIWLLSALVLCCIFQLIQLQLWRKLVARAAAKSVSLRQLMKPFFWPILGKYLPGKALFALARVEMLRVVPINRKVGWSLFLIETLLMLMTAAFMSIFALPTLWQIYGETIINLLYQLSFSYALFITVATILVLGISLAINSFFSDYFARLREQCSHFFRSLELPISDLIILLPQYCLLWFAFGISGLCIVMAIAPTISLSVMQLAFIIASFSAAWLIGFLAVFAPGGIGIREAVIILLLSTLLSVEQATLCAIISRAAWHIAELLGVLLAALMSPAASDHELS